MLLSLGFCGILGLVVLGLGGLPGCGGVPIGVLPGSVVLRVGATFCDVVGVAGVVFKLREVSAGRVCRVRWPLNTPFCCCVCALATEKQAIIVANAKTNFFILFLSLVLIMVAKSNFHY